MLHDSCSCGVSFLIFEQITEQKEVLGVLTLVPFH